MRTDIAVIDSAMFHFTHASQPVICTYVQSLCNRGGTSHVGFAYTVDEQGQRQGQTQGLGRQGQNHAA